MIPTTAQVTGVSGNATLGIDVVFDGTAWYGFVTDASNNTVIRLSYGANLSAQPSVSSLGSIFSSTVTPYDIKIVYDNGQWFGFVYGVNQLISRLDFGSALSNIPTSQIIVPGGPGTTSGLDVVFFGGKWHVVYTQFFTVTVARLNTITSIPGSSDFVSTTLSNTSYRLGDVKVVSSGNNWFAYTVSYEGGSSLQRLSFGNDLFTEADVDDITGTAFGGLLPYGVDVVLDNGKHMLFASTLQGNLIRVDLGSDLLSAPLSQMALGAFQLLSNTLKIKLVKIGSSWQAHTIAYTSGQIFRLFFPSPPCSCTIPTSTDPTPEISYSDDGTHVISVRSFNGNLYDEEYRNLVVQSFEAPVIGIEKNGICLGFPTAFSVATNQQLDVFNWDFGDGNTSPDDAPEHAYSASGTYPVVLKVVSSNGCSNQVSDAIKIYNAPVSSFILPAGLLCTNGETVFTNNTADNFNGNLSYQWYVDGTPISTSRNLQQTFLTTGPKTIKLKTSIPGCFDEDEQITSNVQAGPTVDFSFSGICQGTTTQFTSIIGEVVNSRDWDFDDGGSSSQPDPSHLFTAPGTYTVSLTALSPSGCNNTKTKSVIIRSKPAVDFSVNPPPQSCSSTQTPFTNLTPDPVDSDIASWQWNFDDPASPALSDAKSPSHTFINAGTYNVTLTAATDFGCFRSLQKPIVIAQSPSVSIGHSLACNNLPVNFTSTGNNILTWYWETGTSYYEVPNPVHTFSTPGDHLVKLVVKGINQCETTYNTTVSVPVPLVPDFSVSKNCAGTDAIFTDVTTGADVVTQRTWDFGGLGSATSSPALFKFTSIGNRNVKLSVTGQSGCSYTATKTVSIAMPPTAGFTATPETGASPLSVQFANTSANAAQYAWTFGDGTGTSTQASPAYVFQQTGEFVTTLTATSIEGCESSMSKTIRSVTPQPDVDLRTITMSENTDGTLKVIITLQNNGNTFLKDLPVYVDISGNVTLREMVQGPIAPSALYNVVLSYGLAPANVSFLCARADLQNDFVPNDNRICTELNEKISFINPYPNPAKDILYVEWVAPAKTAVSFMLVDAFGKKMLENNVLSADGLNHFQLDVNGLQGGIYLLVFRDGTSVKTQKVLISAEN